MQEERAEQLRSFSFLSGIVAGFAIASFLQLDLHVTSENPANPLKPFDPTPQSWQLGFAISVGLTVRNMFLACTFACLTEQCLLHATHTC